MCEDVLEEPRRFRIHSDSSLARRMGIKEALGVFFPDFGLFIIVSEERGTDEYTGMPEDNDVEWIDR